MENPTRIVRIELYVVDFEDRGVKSIVDEIESFQDGLCNVVETQVKTVDWSDDHPLNHNDTCLSAYQKLFE
jgi:hypothetical protein